MTDMTPTRSLYPWLMKDYLTLATGLSVNKLHHATLLCGAQGIGKHQLVERLTELIHCQQPTHNKACGNCQDCQLHAGNSHADYYHVACLEAKSQISIEQIRLLSKKLMATGLVNQRRVVVIESINLMTQSAANALLKILEEPPKHVYFLLSASSLSQVPATILSRCFKLNLKLPASDKLVPWLCKKSGKTISPHQLSLLGNSPLRALLALEQDYFSAIDAFTLALNSLYTHWAQRETQLSYCDTLDSVSHFDSIIKAKNPVSSDGELIALIQRFNHEALKGQFGVHTSESMLTAPLLEQLHKIPAIALSNFAQNLGQLNKMMLSNSGLNSGLQLQNAINQTTQEIMENRNNG